MLSLCFSLFAKQDELRILFCYHPFDNALKTSIPHCSNARWVLSNYSTDILPAQSKGFMLTLVPIILSGRILFLLKNTYFLKKSRFSAIVLNMCIKSLNINIHCIPSEKVRYAPVNPIRKNSSAFQDSRSPRQGMFSPCSSTVLLSHSIGLLTGINFKFQNNKSVSY